MSAYRKFSDTLTIAPSRATPPKPAKAPKVDPIEAEALGSLGALGGPMPKRQGISPPIVPALEAVATWDQPEEERAAIVEAARLAQCAGAKLVRSCLRPVSDLPSCV